uniref:INTS5_N domain-containing protein n=1 Tax=Angiostrongylus cantonensis TaxID=6313 RepID=A0A0K0CUX7_ANGCA
MDLESPASPGCEGPGSPSNALVVSGFVEEPEHVEEEVVADDLHGTRVAVRSEHQRKAYRSPQWCERYRKLGDVCDAFMTLATMGDTASVYRRPIWVSLPATDLISPASDAYAEIPSARNAVLGYIGLLIHENAHQYFSEKENPQYGVDYSSVENAAITLMKMVEDFISTPFSKQTVIDVLSREVEWLEIPHNARMFTDSTRSCTNQILHLYGVSMFWGKLHSIHDNCFCDEHLRDPLAVLELLCVADMLL